jgi:methionyl-tRNA formyltransferase
VSGYCRLDDLSAEAGAQYHEFVNVNDPQVLRMVESLSPDLLFVVGLSQLIKQPLLDIPRLGCIGFHPTLLPQGRGRAPLAWLTLGACPGAATFFLLEPGADSGPVLVQEPFAVTSGDYARDVVLKLEEAIDRALNKWLPQLLSGAWNPIPQDHSRATYLGRRAPEDGLIDWSAAAHEIQALIRASSHPHPGAYTYVADTKLIIWRAEVEPDGHFRGVAGRILKIDSGASLLIQTGSGLLKVTAFEYALRQNQPEGPVLRVGMKLGLSAPDEIYVLRQRLAKLEEQFSLLVEGRVSLGEVGGMREKSGEVRRSLKH